MRMRCLSLTFCLFLLAGWTGFVALPGVAASAASSQQAVSTGQTQQGGAHVTIIVLDMSGSMATNDPQGYRCSAANAYIDLGSENDYIGLVGLDNTSTLRSGSHDFQTAQSWINPQSTATVQDKTSLKDVLKSKSNNCSPGANTPTYDALSQAYTMLSTFIKQHAGITGSVILLTDGVPCPDVDSQINAIRSDLLPEFQKSGWPVDTIGLGKDAAIQSSNSCSAPGTLAGTFHDFLSGIAGTSGGQFYDDGHGTVSGVSPLNIAPFFVNIFARYSGETVDQGVSPTHLSGGSIQRNFTAVAGSTKLDVVAVKDSAQAQVSLANPEGQPVGSNTAGVFVSQDNYHVIYSIVDPEPGSWIVTAQGSGQFLLYDLQKTDISLSLDSVKFIDPAQGTSLATPNALPLGQPLTITAHLLSNNQPLSNGTYTLSGTLVLGGGSGQNECNTTPTSFAYPFDLQYNAGNYMGSVNVPVTSPAGTYSVLICASTGTLKNVVASQAGSVRLEIFPIPYLRSPQTHQLTDSLIATTVIQWPLPLQAYALPGLNLLSGPPLQGFSALPQAALSGQVQWNGKAYPGATIRVTALLMTSQTCQTQGTGAKDIPVTVGQDGAGNFTLQFEPPAAGFYRLSFATSGSFQDSQGSFGPQSRCISAVLTPPTGRQLGLAGLFSLLYLLLAVFLYFLGRFGFTPAPSGQWVRNQGSSSESNRSFSRSRRSLLQRFFHRNYVYSRQAGMPRGLELRFLRHARVEARLHGNGSSDWQAADGSPLFRRFQPVKMLIYRSPGSAADDYDAQASFTLMPEAKGKSTRSPGRSQGSSYSNYSGYEDYDAYGGSPRKGKGQKRTASRSAARKGKGRTNRRYDDDLAPWERL